MQNHSTSAEGMRSALFDSMSQWEVILDFSWRSVGNMSMIKVTSLVSGLVRGFLRPPPAAGCLAQARGFKDREVLKLRCPDCYFKKVDFRWWVLCKSHPRHKQREQMDDERKMWIVTHHTIGHRAFQKREEAYICNLAPPGPYDYKRKQFIKTPENAGVRTKLVPGRTLALLRGFR